MYPFEKPLSQIAVSLAEPARICNQTSTRSAHSESELNDELWLMQSLLLCQPILRALLVEPDAYGTPLHESYVAVSSLGGPSISVVRVHWPP